MTAANSQSGGKMRLPGAARLKSTTIIVVLACLVHCCGPTIAAPLEKQRLYQSHGNGWKEFLTLHRAAHDLGAGKSKVSGLTPILLEALSQRIGALVPASSIYKAGCIVAADQLVGPSAWRGTYDLLMKPNTDGHCRAPPLLVDDDEGTGEKTAPASFSMLWENESQEQRSTLPPVSDVYDAVFARRTRSARLPKPTDPALSFWFLSFVNWFHDDNFRTAPNTDGSFTWSDASGLHMAQLYGHTPYRQRALRTLAGDGKMKTSSIGKWHYYPPLWSEVQQDYPKFDMWTPTRGPTSSSSAANKTQAHVDDTIDHYFAIGDPRFNMQPGHILWTSIGLYLHNTACDILMQHASQFWTDEDIFQRARAMTFHIVQKIRLQDFVSDSVSHVRDHIRIPYDPPALRMLVGPHFPFAAVAKPNFLEFNHVYQAWHSLIPDHLVLNGTNVPLHRTMWSPQLFQQFSVGEFAASFADTRIAQYAPHNFPFFVRGVTEDALRHERAQRLPSYNAYRHYVGLEPLTSFDQFTVDDPQTMAQLYDNDIDKVEFLTGLIADTKAELPGNFLGDTQLIIVSILALQDVSNNAVIQNPQLWSAEYLTKEGLEWVKNFEFRDLLENVLLPSDGSDTDVANYPCPFQTTDSQGTDRCQPPEDWKEPDEVESCFVGSACVCSYVGVDVTEWYFYESGYMRIVYLVVLISMMIVTLLYVTVFGLLSYLWPLETKQRISNLEAERYGEQEGNKTKAFEGEAPDEFKATPLTLEVNNNKIFFHRIRLCSLTINFFLSVVLCIPTTILWIQTVSNPYWIQSFGESLYLVLNWTYSLVGFHFVAEIPMRLTQWRYTLDNSNASTARSINAKLTIHHLGFIVLGFVSVFSGDIAVYKMCLTILMAWVWEWTLFGAFWSVRVFDAAYETWRGSPRCNEQMFRSRAYQGLVLYGLPALTLVYFLTRVVESIVLVMLFFCGLQRDLSSTSAAGAFWVVSVLSCVLMGLQYQAGFLLIGLYQRRKASLSKWMTRQDNDMLSLEFREEDIQNHAMANGALSLETRSCQDGASSDCSSAVLFHANARTTTASAPEGHPEHQEPAVEDILKIIDEVDC